MTRRLHIAYVCGDRGVRVGGRSGSSVHVRELIEALRAQGADVSTIAARTDFELGDSDRQVIDLGRQRALRQTRKALLSGVTRARQRSSALETYSLMINQPLARALDRLHRKRRIDAVYERYSLWSFAAAQFARAARVPYLLEANAPLRAEQKRYRGLENDAAAERIETYLFGTASYTIVPSAELRPYVLRRGGRAGRVRVIPNAADPQRFAPRRTWRGAADPFVIGFLGSLKPWHGLDYLLRGFRHLRRRFDGYQLLLVGDGPMRGEIEARLRRTGLLADVRFESGSREQVPELVAAMDVGVAPYPKMSPFYFSPLKVFEYLAGGVPVVASNIGQIGEVLDHRRSALLHSPGRVKEMVEQIDRLRKSPREAQRIGREGRRILCRRFTWKRNAERVLAMIATERGAGRRRISAAGRR